MHLILYSEVAVIAICLPPPAQSQLSLSTRGTVMQHTYITVIRIQKIFYEASQAAFVVLSFFFWSFFYIWKSVEF